MTEREILRRLTTVNRTLLVLDRTPSASTDFRALVREQRRLTKLLSEQFDSRKEED